MNRETLTVGNPNILFPQKKSRKASNRCQNLCSMSTENAKASKKKKKKF